MFFTFLYNKHTVLYEENRVEHHEGFEEETDEERTYESEMEIKSFPVTPKFNPKELKTSDLLKYKTYQDKLKLTNNTFSKHIDFKSYYRKAANNMAMASTSEAYSYANNTLNGNWNKKKLNLYDNTGFRAKGSVYDPINKSLYIVSAPGHLYKINENDNIQWSLRNHKKNLSGDDLNGINLTNNSFRLLHQKENGSMEFSDDEGRTWMNANGAYFQNSWNFKTLVTKKASGARRIVAHGGRYVSPENKGYHRIYISNDYGLNYYTSNTTKHLKIAEFDVKICKPHNSKTVYCFARRRLDSKVFMYRMRDEDTDLQYMGQPVVLNGLESVVGTEVNGNIHFYISFNNKNIFYSSNEGNTWQETSSNNEEGNVLDIHPTQPNICFRGFFDLNLSTDFGATWKTNRHLIGPTNSYYIFDLRHFKTYDNEDGTNFTFAGFDFGAFYTNTPNDFTSWVTVNTGNPTMMSYDAVTSERHNRIYSANQDRGSQSFLEDNNENNTHVSQALREANTDVLRVTISKSGQSAWYWYYYGAIGRSTVVNGGDYKAVTQKVLYARWAATDMVASPNANEDAVYIPWGKNLEKVSYINNKIERSYHPYTFTEPIHSFGYSNLNKKRWYGGLKSGVFMYSTDGGESFTKSNYNGVWPKGVNSHRKSRAIIKASPVNEATVYYAGLGNSFLISTNGGATFTNHNNGLTVNSIVDLDVSTDGKYIFAACDFDGAWVFSTEQDKWFKMDGDDVPEVIAFTSIQYINSSKTARFGTYGCGILDFKINQGTTNELKDGFYKIQLLGSGRCMNASAWGGNGTPIIQWDCVEQNNSKFYVEKQNDNTYAIRASYNNKALTVDQNPINGSALTINNDLNQNNQRFVLKHNGNNYYTINLVNSPNKALAVRGNNIDKLGEPVVNWDIFNQNNYDWRFIPTTIDPVTLSNNNNLIKNKSAASVNIFPNPVTNNFNIVFNEINKPTVTIINTLGKVIYTKTNLTKSSISLSKDQGFATGVYIIKATDVAGKVYTKKFIVN